MNPFANQPEVEIAIITGLFAVIGIIITGIFARFATHPKTPNEDPDDKHKTKESLLTTYSGEQNDFIHLVIKDSEAVHERLNKIDAVVDQMKKDRTELVGAFARYIQKLVASWGTGSRIPYPDDDDFKILEETLPADWRRRTK